MKDEIKENGRLNISCLVKKINELFHLQADNEWEKKCGNIMGTYAKLNYYEGQRTALQNLVGMIDAETDEILSGKLEKIESLIINTNSQLNQLIK